MSFEEFLEESCNVLNKGIPGDTSRDIEQFLQIHMIQMKYEDSQGKPHGQLAWDMMVRLQDKMVKRRDLLRAKEGAGVRWVPYDIK